MKDALWKSLCSGEAHVNGVMYNNMLTIILIIGIKRLSKLCFKVKMKFFFILQEGSLQDVSEGGNISSTICCVEKG